MACGKGKNNRSYCYQAQLGRLAAQPDFANKNTDNSQLRERAEDQKWNSGASKNLDIDREQ